MIIYITLSIKTTHLYGCYWEHFKARRIKKVLYVRRFEPLLFWKSKRPVICLTPLLKNNNNSLLLCSVFANCVRLTVRRLELRLEQICSPCVGELLLLSCTLALRQIDLFLSMKLSIFYSATFFTMAVQVKNVNKKKSSFIHLICLSPPSPER